MRKYLVVDDDPQVGMVAAMMLQELGKVQVVGSISAALTHLYISGPIDLILLDYRMVGECGADLAKFVRKRDCDTAILATSGGITDKELESFLGAGCDGFIEKPYTQEALLEKVIQLTDLSYLRQLRTIHAQTVTIEESLKETADIYEKLAERESQILRLRLFGSRRPSLAARAFTPSFVFQHQHQG